MQVLTKTPTMTSPHLIAFDDRQDAQAHAGMAGQPIAASLHCCGQCAWFETSWHEAATEGHCGLYTRRMGGEKGDAIGAGQRACSRWLTNLGDASR
jgi:hypothetical protein